MVAVRNFLDGIGPYWVPLELDPRKVVERERAGMRNRAAVSEHFMQIYFSGRIDDLTREGNKVVNLAPEVFFQLGAVTDWVK